MLGRSLLAGRGRRVASRTRSDQTALRGLTPWYTGSEQLIAGHRRALRSCRSLLRAAVSGWWVYTRLDAESRVVSEFTLFGGQLLRFLFLRRNLRLLHFAAARTYSAARKPDLERTEPFALWDCSSRLRLVGLRSHSRELDRLACLQPVAYLPFRRCRLVFHVLDIVIGVVLQVRLWCLMACRGLLRGSPLACPAEYRRDNESSTAPT